MSIVKEFKAFVERGNVIDLAVAVVIGTAFGKMVNSLVGDIIMPPLGMIIGGVDFSDLKLGSVRYGAFINSAIDFVIIAVAVFLVIKILSSIKLKQAKAPTERDCPECRMRIPILAKRCGHCTSTIPELQL